MSRVIRNRLFDPLLSKEISLFSFIKYCTKENDAKAEKLVSEIEIDASKIFDKKFAEFVYDFCDQEFIDEFFKIYKEWRTQIFTSKLTQIICDYIKELYPSKDVLRITDIEGKLYHISMGFFYYSS